MAVESSTGQNVYRVVTIEDVCDHQGRFSSFVDCFQKHLSNITGQDIVILCIDSAIQGKPRRDVFNYHPQIGIESIRSQFEEKYKSGIELDSTPENSEQ